MFEWNVQYLNDATEITSWIGGYSELRESKYEEIQLKWVLSPKIGARRYNNSANRQHWDRW